MVLLCVGCELLLLICLVWYCDYICSLCLQLCLGSYGYSRRHVAPMGEERGVYRVLLGKLEGRRPLGRPRRRWVDNIRMDLQEVGCGYMDWIGLTQDRDRWRTLVSAVMNLRVPWNAGNFLTSCKPVSFSRRTLHHGVSKEVLNKSRQSFNEVCCVLHMQLTANTLRMSISRQPLTPTCCGYYA